MLSPFNGLKSCVAVSVRIIALTHDLFKTRGGHIIAQLCGAQVKGHVAEVSCRGGSREGVEVRKGVVVGNGRFDISREGVAERGLCGGGRRSKRS